MALKSDTKFLATPGFVLKSAEGQSLTLNIKPKLVGGNYTKWYDVSFDPALYALTGSSVTGSGIQAITPEVNTIPDLDYGTPPTTAEMAIYRFLDFISKNPAHVTRLNFRASKMSVIPTQITVCTPNMFSGQVEKQTLNVTAASNMYQNQSDMVTVDCDMYLGRNSFLEFNAAFSEATAPTLNIDVKIDCYLSLEKSIYENLLILSTASGQAAAIQNATADQEAIMEPSMVADSAIQAAMGVATKVAPRGSNNPMINRVATWDKGNR